MIVLNSKNIIDKIRRSQYTTVRIFEGHGKDSEGRNQFENITTSTPEELIEEVKKFSNIFPGRYSFYLAKNKDTNRANSDLVNVTLEIDQQQTQPLNGNHNLNIEEIKEKAYKELKEQFEREKKQEEKEEQIRLMKEELDHLKTTGGKLANVAYKFLMNLQEGQKMKKALQGTQEKRRQEIRRESNQHQRNENNNANMEDMTELEEALGHLVKVFGEDTLIKLASVINENDSMIPTIEAYIEQRFNEDRPSKKNNPKGSSGSGKRRFY